MSLTVAMVVAVWCAPCVPCSPLVVRAVCGRVEVGSGWEWLRVSIGIEALASRHIPYILDACQDWHELAQYGPPYWRTRSEAELQRKIAATSGPVPGVEYNFVLVDDGGDAQESSSVGAAAIDTRRPSGVGASEDVASPGAGSRLVGECSLHAIDWRNRVAQVGVCLWQPEERRRGYGRQAVGFLLEWATGQLGMERLEAWILATNLPSQRLVTQLGFVREGTLRGRYLLDGVRQDMAVYGWQAG